MANSLSKSKKRLSYAEDIKTLKQIESMAKLLGKTKTDIVRDAVKDYLKAKTIIIREAVSGLTDEENK